MKKTLRPIIHGQATQPYGSTAIPNNGEYSEYSDELAKRSETLTDSTVHTRTEKHVPLRTLDVCHARRR